MNVLVVGGCGYIGSLLVPFLLADGHHVTVHDNDISKGFLPENEHCKVLKQDLRDYNLFDKPFKGQDAVIYLAAISNNDFCTSHPEIHKAVNLFGFIEAALAGKEVERFIYASSVAAYGSCDYADENKPLEPTTVYGSGKKFCEEWLKTLQNYTIVRAATVCGHSPSMRFDTTVNRMFHDAIHKGVIHLNGGEQKRCHVHIQDVVDFYRFLLNSPIDKVTGQTFNLVAQNQAIIDTAETVALITGAKIVFGPRTDDRSYTVSGEKIKALGYYPRFTISDAVKDMYIRKAYPSYV